MTSLTTRRALSLLELMLSLVIIALIAGAVSGMMAAVTTGVSTRRDNRSTMVCANAAATRLGGYVAIARCLLDADESDLVIWLNDERESDTVHATEVRWFRFDAESGEYQVHFVSFPDSWTQAAKDLEDRVYPADANWNQVFNTYDSKGWTAAMPLVDGLGAVTVAIDRADPLAGRHVSFTLSFPTSSAATDVTVAATVRMHEPPAS